MRNEDSQLKNKLKIKQNDVSQDEIIKLLEALECEDIPGILCKLKNKKKDSVKSYGNIINQIFILNSEFNIKQQVYHQKLKKKIKQINKKNTISSIYQSTRKIINIFSEVIW